MLLCLLQNAWSGWYTRIGRPGEEIHRLKDRVWHRDDWLDATWSCKTGQNLMKILKGVPDEDIWLDDTTLEIADKASGVRKPDLAHVVGVLRERNITSVLACGKQAGKAIDKVWRGPLVKIPHPAVRGLSTQVLSAYNTEVHEMLRYANNYRTYRVSLDSGGFQSEGTIETELNFGNSWIREGFDQSPEGIAGCTAGDHPAILPG